MGGPIGPPPVHIAPTQAPANPGPFWCNQHTRDCYDLHERELRVDQRESWGQRPNTSTSQSPRPYRRSGRTYGHSGKAGLLGPRGGPVLGAGDRCTFRRWIGHILVDPQAQIGVQGSKRESWPAPTKGRPQAHPGRHPGVTERPGRGRSGPRAGGLRRDPTPGIAPPP